MCKKGGCCDAPVAWSRGLLFLRIIMGIMFFVLGIYDFIKPLKEDEKRPSLDLRDLTLDLYFCGLGFILATSTFIERCYFAFGFLKNNAGAGFTLLFSGMLAVGSWDLSTYETWACISALAGGGFFIYSWFMFKCCGWTTLDAAVSDFDGSTPEERKGLLDSEAPSSAAGGFPVTAGVSNPSIDVENSAPADEKTGGDSGSEFGPQDE